MVTCDPNYDPTDAELDAMIAEQMQCLPPWWRSEQQKDAERLESERWRLRVPGITLVRTRSRRRNIRGGD